MKWLIVALSLLTSSAQADDWIFIDEDGVVQDQVESQEETSINRTAELMMLDAISREQEYEHWVCNYQIPTGLDMPNPFEPEEWNAYQVIKEECNR
jgi:hypothetical protein